MQVIRSHTQAHFLY